MMRTALLQASVSIPSLMSWNTGSPAFAGADGCEATTIGTVLATLLPAVT
jgi:hypothetical protein